MAGLTVEQLADEARTSRQTLWRWCEHGKTPVWSIREDVQAVLEEYGVVFLPKTKDHGPGVAMALPETDG